MPVELRNAQRSVKVDVAKLKRAAEAAAERLGLQRVEVSVLITGDKEIAKLHDRWMGDPAPTDVLSFPLQRLPLAGNGAPALLGDIVISAETARKRAGASGTAREIIRYLIHGLLHLTGHDHAEPKDKLKMDREAKRLMTAVAPMLR